MTRTSGQGGATRQRIMLLAAQAFALGLMMAWLLVGASTIFLDRYGSQLLPVTYVGAALAGAASSAAIKAALRTKSLVMVASRVLVGLSALLMFGWLLLWVADVPWVSFALLVIVPILVPVGFMFLVGQAGMLLDVRALKALYARVIAGFALGFVTGGLAGPILLNLLGRTEHLLAAAAAASGLWVLLLTVTRRRFGPELANVEDADRSALGPGVGDLMRDRYVRLIVAFQMASAIESQWLDYLVLDRAARRYEDSRDLAEFISRFTAIAYGADILFLLVAAGLLLRRFGLRYGLIANPAGVLTLLALMTVAASLQGAGATLVFVTVVGARVTDLVLSDGAARNSLSAAYQVVPTSLRQAAQATVEGLAVPLAIGASGVGLLLLQATVGTDGAVLPGLTSIVVVSWAVVALLVHRGYRVSLLASLRYRTLDMTTLSIDDASSLPLIDRLIESPDWRDVRLGLDTLSAARHPALAERLHGLATRNGGSLVKIDALERLLRVDLALATSAARAGLADQHAEVRAACVRILGEAQDPVDLDLVVAQQRDGHPAVQVAVAAAMARIGDDDVRARVAAEIARRSRSSDPDDRVSAARMLESCPSAAGLDRAPLRDLLVDDAHTVVISALEAIRWPDDSEHLEAVLACLTDRHTTGTALEALAPGGQLVLDAIDRRLLEVATDRRAQELLIRLCRTIGGSVAADVLRRHVGHHDREVGLWVMEALAVVTPTGRSQGAEGLASKAVTEDVGHAAEVVAALDALADLPSAALLISALRDELRLLQRRTMAALSMRYGEDALSRVAFQLSQDDGRVQALALEWLDVTLSGPERAALPLLDPGLSDSARLRAILGRRPPQPPDVWAVLCDLVADPEGRWRQPWVQACALLAAHGLPDRGLSILEAAADTACPATPVGDASVLYDTRRAIHARLLASGSATSPDEHRPGAVDVRGRPALEDDRS